MTAVAQPSSERSRVSLPVAIVAGSAIAALALGVRSTFGLFQDPVTESLGSGRGAFGLAIAAQNLAWGLSQPVAGAIADRFGTARVLTFGVALYSAGLLIMAQATNGVVFFFSAGVLVGMATGAASFAVVLAAVGRMAPPEKRSLALGIVSAMGSVGQFFLVPLTQRLLDRMSWESVALVLAAIVLVTAVFTPVLRGRAVDQQRDEERNAAQNMPLRHELHRAASSRSYVLLNAAFFVCGFHVTFIATHLPAYTGDLGIDASVAASALALIGLFNVFGSLTAGALGGRYSKTKLLAGIYGLRGIVIAAYVLTPLSGTSTLVFGAAMGVLWLSTVPLTSGIVTTMFGTTHAGTLFGIVFLSHQFGAFAGAWMGGGISDATGSFEPVWWIAVGLGVFAMVLHLMIDEGPVPEPPVSGHVPAGVAPAAGLAAVVLVAGTTGALLSAAPVAADHGASEARAVICVLGPSG